MARNPSPEAAVLEIDVRVLIKDGILISVRDTARILGKSHSYLKEKLRDPSHELSRLAPFFRDLNGGKGKPSWKIRWKDLEAFQLDLPRMSNSDVA